MSRESLAEHPRVCPQCSLADRTYKVSLLYLESSARLNRREREGQPELDSLLADLLPENSSRAAEDKVLTGIVHTFSPPSGEKRITRRIHPDAMIGLFALLAIFLVYRISIDQPEAFPYALILLFAVLLFYLLTRKAVVGRYEARKREEQAANQRVEREVSRWMRLYFCSRDQGVFYPGQCEFAPAEQVRSFLQET